MSIGTWRGGVCVRGAARSNCHMLALSNLRPTEGKPLACPPPRDLRARDWKCLLSLVFGLCFECCWSDNFGFLVKFGLRRSPLECR